MRHFSFHGNHLTLTHASFFPPLPLSLSLTLSTLLPHSPLPIPIQSFETSQLTYSNTHISPLPPPVTTTPLSTTPATTTTPSSCLCPEGSYQCDNCAKCFTDDLRCDRKNDCEDKSDEEGCGCITEGEEKEDGAEWKKNDCTYCRCEDGQSICEKRCEIDCEVDYDFACFKES